MNASQVIECLKSRFAPPAFAFLEQVADATGARHRRWADAVAMSLWPSRGFDIHGIEVKVSRYDFVNELKQPEKSAAVQQYCNRWWIATPDESIIQSGELPPTWGWMVTNGKGGMRTVVEAPALIPAPVSIDFLASVLRNVQKADDSAVQRRIDKAAKEAREQGDKYYREKYVELKKSVEAFHQASGVEIHEWNGGEIGEAVQTLRNLQWKLEAVDKAVKTCSEIGSMLDTIKTLANLTAKATA